MTPMNTAAPPSAATVYLQAATLGAVTGLWSTLPLALLAIAAHRPGTGTAPAFAADAPWPLGLLRTRGALLALGLAALGEVVADKRPSAPSRLAPPFLGERLIAGALAGAAVCRNAQLSPALGAILGASGAGGGSVAGYNARTLLDKTTDVPSIVWGVTEDAMAIGLGLLALRRYVA